MPSCCLTGCQNRGENGYRLFRIPSGKGDDLRRKAWVAFINRSDLPERALLCETHFKANQFEVNRLDNRKLLKRSAIPTIRPPEFLQKQGMKRKISDPSLDVPNSSMFVTQAQLEITSAPLHFGTSINKSDQEENTQLKCLQNKLRAATAQIAALKNQITKLEEQFKIIFSEDQIHLLKYGNHRGKEWSDETIQKALKLYVACGKKGYEELCRQKFPLPAIRTLAISD